MSVINQVLLNLEKRGASVTELELLPDHVQLPQESARAHRWGLVAAGVAFAVAVPTGWIAFNAMVAEPTHSPVASGAGGVKVASASLSESLAARPDERDAANLQETGVFRLSFELSNLPADPAPRRGTEAPKVAVGIKDPLSSARLPGRTDAKSATEETRAGLAAPSRSTASAGAAKVAVGMKDPLSSAQLLVRTDAKSATEETRAGLAAPSRSAASAGAAKVAVGMKDPLSSAQLLGRKDTKSATDKIRAGLAAPGRSAGATKVAVGMKDPLSSAQQLGRTDTKSAPKKIRAGSAAPRRSVASAGPAPVKPAVKVISIPPEIRKQVRTPTPRELADHQYRQAVALLDQNRRAEADTGLRKALNLYPQNHQARQVLVGLLVQGRRLEEAERMLEGGVELSPAQTGFNLTLARLQAHRGDSARAIATLQNGLKYARSNAEYAAFLATLLQRDGKHEEAIKHFQAALRLRPSFGVWWVGLGISLQAANQPEAALDAYRRARAGGNLHPHVAALAEQRVKQLQ